MWQIYLPAPKHIPRGIFDVSTPNEAHQADLLFLPHDRKFKYALTVIDVASRYKEAEPLKTKNSSEVAKAFEKIYKRSLLTYPSLLMVDPGREFMGEVSRLMAKHKVNIRRGIKEIHRDQGLAERFNRTLSERLFSHQYAQELKILGGFRSREWVKRLPAVIAALNNEKTRLIDKKPIDAIKMKNVRRKSLKSKISEKLLPFNVKVRYLYFPGELEGGTTRRATDPIWSVDIYEIERVLDLGRESPLMYYLRDGPKQAFVRQELQVVPENTALPP